jgi:hypothetical protein
MMIYLLFQKNWSLMRLIVFVLIRQSVKSQWSDVEISNEWVWNQNKEDLIACMHLERLRSAKKWIVIINSENRNDEMSSMLVLRPRLRHPWKA